MGDLRFREIQEEKKTLGLASIEVLDYEDSLLKEMDPRVLENEVTARLKNIRPLLW